MEMEMKYISVLKLLNDIRTLDFFNAFKIYHLIDFLLKVSLNICL